jgi:3-hydroxyacyl-[acyl-carrier-protein] dehydratase
LVCLGIFLLNDDLNKNTSIALTSTDIEFLNLFSLMKSECDFKKIYFRFGKLKCKVIMKNEQGVEVCTGIIAGMILSK